VVDELQSVLIGEDPQRSNETNLLVVTDSAVSANSANRAPITPNPRLCKVKAAAGKPLLLKLLRYVCPPPLQQPPNFASLL